MHTVVTETLRTVTMEAGLRVMPVTLMATGHIRNGVTVVGDMDTQLNIMIEQLPTVTTRQPGRARQELRTVLPLHLVDYYLILDAEGHKKYSYFTQGSGPHGSYAKGYYGSHGG